MPLELDLAWPATSRVRDSGDSREVTAERSAGELAVQPARIAPTTAAAAAPAFLCHPLARSYPYNVAAPRAGELHLWRFRCEWLPVPMQESDSWMSKSERERARLHPNAAVDIDVEPLFSNIATPTFDLAEHGRWHVLDVPMAGKIRAAVALAQPLTQVHAFGWPKALAFGQANAQRPARPLLPELGC